jgi:hypothetical protein
MARRRRRPLPPRPDWATPPMTEAEREDSYRHWREKTLPQLGRKELIFTLNAFRSMFEQIADYRHIPSDERVRLGLALDQVAAAVNALSLADTEPEAWLRRRLDGLGEDAYCKCASRQAKSCARSPRTEIHDRRAAGASSALKGGA